MGLTESRLSHWWQRVRAEIGLKDVRVHDLRHAAASLALNAGIPLAAIAALLGHGTHSQSMTARYSHLSDRMLADAAAKVGERLAMLQGPAAGNA
jgi:integrase